MPKGEVDLSEFAAEVVPIGPKCWAAALTPEQLAKVQAAHDAGHTNPTIVRVLQKWGHDISDFSVGRHLRGSCRCPK